MKSFALLLVGAVFIVTAQEPNPTQAKIKRPEGVSAPVYQVNVVAGTTKAISYRRDGKWTTVGFQGTVLLPRAEGQARVRGRTSAFEIQAEWRGLEPPHRFGAEYLTYVLWAVTPEGRASNLGEIGRDARNRGRLRTATELQTFALLVTAEPYFSVTQPSDVVVMENVTLPGTSGEIQAVDAKFELLQRGQYTFDPSAARGQEATGRRLRQDEYDALVALYQARNAVQLAEAQGAHQHAAEALDRAKEQLAQAEQYHSRKAQSRLILEASRRAAQTAEDARLIALRRQNRSTQGDGN